MSVWLQRLKHQSRDVVFRKREDIRQEDIHAGRVYGTFYIKQGTSPNRGVLMLPGVSGSRHALGVLGQHLADAGFFALSIDLPLHNNNLNDRLTFGETSEIITEAVLLMRRQYGMTGVVVLAHSTSALAALFSAMGYNVAVEESVYKLWEYIYSMLAYIQLIVAKFPTYNTTPLFENIEKAYGKIQTVVVTALKNGIASHTVIAGYILLAAPLHFKGAFPGICLLRPLPPLLRNRVFETLIIHKRIEKKHYKEGHEYPYVREQNPEYARWWALKTQHLDKLLEYIQQVREPKDFLKLMEDFASGEQDEHTNFFRYCQKFLERKPKLFIYGKWDFYLRPFIPGKRKQIEQFYRSCTNAEIYYGDYSHIMRERAAHQVSTIGVTNPEVTERIMLFLDQHLRRFI
ncbi:hypothetical protein HYU16_04155 [Candidatus Woesearchaeota archaeon]|nr:hypothetical protein [Candidatus Woesearchaeota archaeon]